MEETYLMNEIKEKCCYVSSDFANDLKTCQYIFFFSSKLLF